MHRTGQSSPVIEIDNLSLELATESKRRVLVDRFSLAVHPGELVGLVGETGSGKSISMMATVGLLNANIQPVAGHVSFRGVRSTTTDARALRGNLNHGIALMFQNARGALNPFMRVGDQINRVLKLKGVRRGERSARIAAHLQSVGLSTDDMTRKYPHQISGGQSQRVALACALATEPVLLIADEPTTALDVTTEHEILLLMQQLCIERAMGLVLITHNLALVSQMCDRVVLMHAGHIVEEGSVLDTFARPLHPYTRGLLRVIPDVDRPRDLVPMPGSVWGGPQGVERCRFSHRCEHAWERCHESMPPFYDIGGQRVRCFLYDRIDVQVVQE
jgi:oligopeptide/dipeptide ABC transporter ATP-binding protein